MKAAILDKVLDRLGQLGTGEVQGYLERMAREQGVLGAIFDAIREGILVIDEGGTIRYHNPAAASMLGFGPGGAVGQGIGRHVRGLDWEALVRAGASASRDLEITYPERRYLSVYAIPLTPGERDGFGAALVLHDATASRQAMDERAESERAGAVMTLAASVAHELGNPLNSFDIHLQLMERELRKLREGEGARLREAVRVSRQEVRRLDGIIKNFLKAIRPAPPDLRPAALNRIVREAVEFLRPEIEGRDLIVEMDLADRLPRLMLDADQIRQAFLNLIKNAMEAMRTGGILRIRTEVEEDWVSAIFRDTGGGFDATALARRGEAFLSTKPEGTGLGLMVVSRIVGSHGGQLEIKSQPGVGTDMRVRFPKPGPRVKLLAAPGAARGTSAEPRTPNHER
ncbi:MAG: PAS domain-containing protein [Verrucomicrobiae bacterium]|nr:PAS domain-containing protein [Verrucomicrobiae bacterium]